MWSLRREGGQTLACVLQGVGEPGWDVVLLRDGLEFYGRRWTLRAEALVEAEELRRELECEGWRLGALTDP